MGEPCARRSPLSRSGLTQAGRHRAELGGDYFRIDGRSIADLILFGRNYARHIQYYDAANQNQGDWLAFFDSDVSAGLAILAKLPVESFVQFQRDLEIWLKADPARDRAALGAHFKLLFHLPLALLQEAGAAIERLPAGHAMTQQVGELARRELAQPLRALIGWYKGATEAGGPKLFKDEGPQEADYKTGPGADPRLRLSSSMRAALLGRKAPTDEPLANVITQNLGTLDWTAIWAATEADATLFSDSRPDAYEQIYDALEHNLFECAIRDIYRAAARLKRDAEIHLRESLGALGGHAPHYALWLTFLRLFAHAQESLNAFTGRHLDHYFREVLQLAACPAVPDRVHLLFELTRGTDAHAIAAGTAFRAGKDALGRPVTYALEQTLVANRGRVAALSALRIDTAPDGALARVASDVRSLDGAGNVPLPPDSSQWPAFGPADAPYARVGFAIADRKLFLREGRRTIRLRADLAGPLDFDPASDAWRIRLTGPEGWWEPSQGVTVRTSGWSKSHTSQSGSSVEFRLDLGGGAPAIEPFDPKLHGDGTGVGGPPRIEISFDFEKASAARAFGRMRDVQLDDIVLQVSANGLKQLSVDAGCGPADPSKPFAPFGAQPGPGAALIVGSQEIFSKPISTLELSVDWQQAYDPTLYFEGTAASAFTVTEAVLKDGAWQVVGAHNLFGGGSSTRFQLQGANLIAGGVAQTGGTVALTPASVGGFVRLTLNRGFGHADYPLANARALIRIAKSNEDDQPQETGPAYLMQKADSASGNQYWKVYSPVIEHAEKAWTRRDAVPRSPYDSVVTRIEASYQSEAGTAEQFTHLHPLGATRADPRSGPLFPQMPYAGALLIGIADLEPPAKLSLLIQVADGTGSPLVARPPLQFDYLAGDQWRAFEQRDVDDKTLNLATSGLLGLAVPAAANRRHSAMPDGLHWIRITTPSAAEAFNQVLSVDAQAGRAVLMQAIEEARAGATALPAGTISKLVRSDPAIKKVRQPYASFGGRATESADEFATRVSERLRHKDRAVAAFDYEALILGAFPQLFRAKCLPTTALMRDSAGRIVADNEVAPGAVTVVTVPWVHGGSVHNPLRPYADQALVAAVDAFLRKRVSPFVQLEIQNPKFEEVHAAFNVRFRRDIADIAFYKDALNDALVEFLTPWSRADGGEIMFGGRLWKSALIDFVEERPEVDFISDFRMYHKPDADAQSGDWTPVDVEMIEATTARSILVSAARHEIGEVARDA